MIVCTVISPFGGERALDLFVCEGDGLGVGVVVVTVVVTVVVPAGSAAPFLFMQLESFVTTVPLEGSTSVVSGLSI